MRWWYSALLAAGVVALPALAHAQLKLEEVRPTYGRLGTTRTSTKVLPGEDLVVEFIVSGVVPDADGMANIELSASLEDSRQRTISDVPPASTKVFLALGGSRFTGFVQFSLPPDCEPGKYLVRGKVIDQVQQKNILLEQSFDVQPANFGIVRLRLANDALGDSPAGGNLTINQRVFVHATAVSFGRAGKSIHVASMLTLLDSEGRRTFSKPIAAAVINQVVDDDLVELGFKLPIVVNRTGKYIVQLELRDEISKKTVVQELPIVVYAAPSLRNERREATRTND